LIWSNNTDAKKILNVMKQFQQAMLKQKFKAEKNFRTQRSTRRIRRSLQI